MRLAQPECDRDQMVLFASRLDEAVDKDHLVRVVDQVLGRVDWRPMENLYHQPLGQPPIHPRVLCAVILYGLICRIRASRKLEEALQVRLDFRWLAQGMSIDHTTLSEFRRKHPDELRDLFVQVVMIGKELGLVTFQRIAFDGTRVRASNRRTGTRTPDQLRSQWLIVSSGSARAFDAEIQNGCTINTPCVREMKAKLQAEFDRLSEKADAEDSEDEEVFAASRPDSGIPGEEPDDDDPTSDAQPSDAQRREQRRRQIEQAQANVEAALAELEKIEDSSEKTPARLPVTDPESRLGKNKEGGFAPNYTPTATVDCDSGMIVDETVIPQSNESGELLPTIEQVQQDYGLDAPVPEVLADGLMATGENLRDCADAGVNLFSPVPGTHTGENPAVRDDPTEPVPADAISSLPMRNVTIDGQKEHRFDKQAFVYVEAEDVYRCPQGEALTKSSSYTTTESGKPVQRTRYRASETSCSSCPLATLCLSGKAKFRQIDRGEYDAAIEIERQKSKMQQPESQSIYATRRSVGERPFAVMKHIYGVRQFLTRGLSRVRQEWTWASVAFNLEILASHLAQEGLP